MTAAVEAHNEHVAPAHAHAGEHSWTDKKYVMVAIYLAIMTAVEVALSYIHPSFAPWPRDAVVWLPVAPSRR